MRIVCTQHIDAGEWDGLAASQGGGFFHCHAQTVYEAARLGTEPLFVRALDDGGRCVGVAAGTISTSRMWPLSRYCRYAMFHALPAAVDGTRPAAAAQGTPAAARATPLAAQALVTAIEEELRRSGAFAVRISSYDSPLSGQVLAALGYELEPKWEFDVDLAPNVETIWASFEGRRRTDIRKAEKLGVETRIENTPEAVRLAFEFHGRSMIRRGAEADGAGSEADLAARHLLATGCVDVLVSYRDGRAVNAALFGCFNRAAYYLVSGSSDEGNQSCGPVHLLWTAMKTYRERGCVRLNLGGAAEHEASLHKFKSAFHPTITAEPGGTKKFPGLGASLDYVRRIMRR